MMVGPQGGRYIGNKGGLVMLQCPEYSAIVPITWIAIELQQTSFPQIIPTFIFDHLSPVIVPDKALSVHIELVVLKMYLCSRSTMTKVVTTVADEMLTVWNAHH